MWIHLLQKVVAGQAKYLASSHIFIFIKHMYCQIEGTKEPFTKINPDILMAVNAVTKLKYRKMKKFPPHNKNEKCAT